MRVYSLVALAALLIAAGIIAVAIAADSPPVPSVVATNAALIPPMDPAEPAAAPNPSPAQATAQIPAPPAPSATPPAAASLNQAQLEQLLAPIALYPDPLLSQILMASTYPAEVAEAAHWVAVPANRALAGAALAAALRAQNWDPSVMALVPFPRVLAMMSEQSNWTQQLGNAFLAQQAMVMGTVQSLRRQAMAAGNLKTTPECKCVVSESGGAVTIRPVNPQLVCVPSYSPAAAYGSWREPAYPPFAFPVVADLPPPPPEGFIAFYPPVEVAVYGPLWGWSWIDWTHGYVAIDSARYALAVGHAPAFIGGIWVHDTGHRRGIAYADAGIPKRLEAERFAAGRVVAGRLTGSARFASPRGGAARFAGPRGAFPHFARGGGPWSGSHFGGPHFGGGPRFGGPFGFHGGPMHFAMGGGPHGGPHFGGHHR